MKHDGSLLRLIIRNDQPIGGLVLLVNVERYRDSMVRIIFDILLGRPDFGESDEAGNRDRDARAQGRFQRVLVDITCARNALDYDASAVQYNINRRR